MKIVGIEKLSLVDFDEEISMTFFVSGCNMRCPFCHNSSLVFEQVEKVYSKEEIKEILESHKHKIDAIVVTGGEPTLYPDLPELMKLIKSYGYLAKLDTNGTNPEMVKYLAENHLVDYFAVDVKNSYEKYAETVGYKSFPLLDKVKETINFLLHSDLDYEFRTTLIDEFHGEEEMQSLIKSIAGAKRYRLQKFINSEYCIRHDLHEVNKEKAKKYRGFAANLIKDVELRSY